MFRIYKLRADHVVDFAAEELKKYLRMMMPRCGDIAIDYNPKATDGFRLGFLEDFGLENEAPDPFLDDIVHVDTTEEGGILAGSNQRSVLFAVYRFLRLNGCRWLYPGVDGEYIPMQAITAQKYHKMADHRFRGHCNEGAESQTCMLETIDFYAKQELSVYMLEDDIPGYYHGYYSHTFNAKNRPPEPVSDQQILQWKRQCEVEIAKRGMMFHDIGHGWTARALGIHNRSEFDPSKKLPDVQTAMLAQMNGVRDLYLDLHGNRVLDNTNLCMSNPEVRKLMVQSVVNYAENATNVSYLHVWLADGSNNHCECENCQKLTPSDFYMQYMNELDEALTAKGLDTRIVFICYVDTMFAPEKFTITNPERFSMLYAPIHRTYTASTEVLDEIPEPIKYVRNNYPHPQTPGECLALLRAWQEKWPGMIFGYEYHFWKHQTSDPTGLYLARRVYEDIRSLQYMGIHGYVEDGSQRSFFPNGFPIYVYAETLMNRDVDFDELTEDYFSHIYGEDWRQVHDYLTRVQACFDFKWLEGEWSTHPTAGTEEGKNYRYYNPPMVELLEKVPALAKEGEALAKAHLAMPTRPQTVSYRLLLRQAEFIVGFAEVMKLLAVDEKKKALEVYTKFCHEFGKYEFEIERYFDQNIYFMLMNVRIARKFGPPTEGL